MYMYIITCVHVHIYTVEVIKKLTFRNRFRSFSDSFRFYDLKTLKQSLRMRVSTRNHMNAKYGRSR